MSQRGSSDVYIGGMSVGSELSERWRALAGESQELQRRLELRFGRSVAEDAAQEAIVRAASRRTELPPATQRARWLARIAANFAIDRWRRARREVDLSLAEHLRWSDAETEASTLDLREALQRLRAADRALLLQRAAGYSYLELAAAYRCDAGSVRQRVARARARLLAILGGSTE